MSKIIIEINTDNDAFAGNNHQFELAQMLKQLGSAIENGEQPEHLRDNNGKLAGHVYYDDDKPSVINVNDMSNLADVSFNYVPNFSRENQK